MSQALSRHVTAAEVRWYYQSGDSRIRRQQGVQGLTSSQDSSAERYQSVSGRCRSNGLLHGILASCQEKVRLTKKTIGASHERSQEEWERQRTAIR